MSKNTQNNRAGAQKGSSNTRIAAPPGKNPGKQHTTLVRTLHPIVGGGLQQRNELSLMAQLAMEKAQAFARVESKTSERAAYAHNWARANVDQGLSDDPGPINSSTFKPVSRWIVAYRTPEGGQDGTHSITVSDLRTAIAGAGTAASSSFVVKEFHVWIAPTAVSTHFSGVIYIQDDEANGILAGEYSDIAPYGEFVKFRIRYSGEGLVNGATSAGTKIDLRLGGSQKWNAIIYALVEMYD